jgi:hypothetical protein
LAGLLSCYMAHSSHHIKNSVEFVHALHSLWFDTHGIMVSFDVVSLITKLPIKETWIC